MIGIGRRIATHECARIGEVDAELGGIDAVRADCGSDELVHRARRRGRELVEAVVAVEHHRMVGAELTQRAEHRLGHRRVGDTDHLPAHTGRVDERAEEVERRRHTELFARGSEEPHRGVVARREAEADAGRVDAGRDAIRSELDRDAERFEDVCRAAVGGRGAVAVLHDPHTRTRRDQRSHRRDVDGARAVAAGAARIDCFGHDIDMRGEAPHRAYERGHLGHRFALGPQRDDESRRLHVADTSFEDLGERGREIVGRHRLAAQQPRDDRCHDVIHASDTASPTRGLGRARRARSDQVGSETSPRRS